MDKTYLVASNRSNGREVASRVVVADTPRSRAVGLLNRASLEPGEGLWIIPCWTIHTFFMRFAIDVLFLDKGLVVRRVLENLRPWRFSPWVLSAWSVLELPAGSLRGAVGVGDRLEIR